LLSLYPLVCIVPIVIYCQVKVFFPRRMKTFSIFLVGDLRIKDEFNNIKCSYVASLSYICGVTAIFNVKIKIRKFIEIKDSSIHRQRSILNL
jgi:hypothetical protein